MDCHKAEKLLVEYLYQELSPEKTLEVEKHLETCDACAKTLHNWRGIHRGFQRSNDVPQPAPFLKTRILAAAREEVVRKPAWSEQILSWVKPALILPILVFGLLVLLFLPNRQPEMAKASKVPAQSTPALLPAAPPPQKTAELDKESLEKLKSLGYIGEAKQQPPASAPAADFRSKTERQSTEARDRIATGTLAEKAKENETGLQQELAGGERSQALKDATQAENQPAQEPAPPPQYSLDVQQQKKMAQSPPSAAAPANMEQPSEVAAGAGKPDAKLANFDKAQFYFKNNDLASGKNAADEAIRSDKDSSLAAQFHQAGRQYQEQGETQQAIVQYNLVLNNYPSYNQNADVLLRLGESYEQIGEYDKAIRVYQQLERIASMKNVASEKLRTLSKKRQVQEQLRSLGYVDKNKNR